MECNPDSWRLGTLRITANYACLLCSNFGQGTRDIWQAQTIALDIPASVRVLHLYTFAIDGFMGSRTKYRPTLTGASLRELHVDLNTWDATLVRMRRSAHSPQLLTRMFYTHAQADQSACTR